MRENILTLMAMDFNGGLDKAEKDARRSGKETGVLTQGQHNL